MEESLLSTLTLRPRILMISCFLVNGVLCSLILPKNYKLICGQLIRLFLRNVDLFSQIHVWLVTNVSGLQRAFNSICGSHDRLLEDAMSN